MFGAVNTSHYICIYTYCRQEKQFCKICFYPKLTGAAGNSFAISKIGTAAGVQGGVNTACGLTDYIEVSYI